MKISWYNSITINITTEFIKIPIVINNWYKTIIIGRYFAIINLAIQPGITVAITDVVNPAIILNITKTDQWIGIQHIPFAIIQATAETYVIGIFLYFLTNGAVKKEPRVIPINTETVIKDIIKFVNSKLTNDLEA